MYSPVTNAMLKSGVSIETVHKWTGVPLGKLTKIVNGETADIPGGLTKGTSRILGVEDDKVLAMQEKFYGIKTGKRTKGSGKTRTRAEKLDNTELTMPTAKKAIDLLEEDERVKPTVPVLYGTIVNNGSSYDGQIRVDCPECGWQHYNGNAIGEKCCRNFPEYKYTIKIIKGE